MIYRFERHSLDVDRRELRRGTEIVAIEPQVFDLLRFLVSQRNRVVSKDDLLAEVWRGRVVSESTLASRVAALRRAIGDSGKEQRLVRTVSRKGFRFVGMVLEEAAPEPRKEAETAQLPRQETGGLASGVRSVPPERRQLTIMACCVDGAGAIASRLDPEDLGDLMAQCRGSFRRAVERNGGFVAKHTVDGLLAYFGYPRANEDDPENAVRAGLAASKAFGGLRSQVVSELLWSRVGIATGLVVVGDLNGADASPEHEAAGETLHLANRLLDAGIPGAVVISDNTRQLIGGLFDCRPLGTSWSPKQAEPVAAWHVVRESAMLNRFEGLRSSRTRLVGREEELELLVLRWNQAKTGEGRVVLMWGEPGIGKSRLVAALQDALISERCSCLRFFCAPHRTSAVEHRVREFAPDFECKSAR